MKSEAVYAYATYVQNSNMAANFASRFFILAIIILYCEWIGLSALIQAYLNAKSPSQFPQFSNDLSQTNLFNDSQFLENYRCDPGNLESLRKFAYF